MIADCANLCENNDSGGGCNVRDYDAYGRASGVILGDEYAVTYGYDNLGRFSSVSSSVDAVSSAVNYSYLPGSTLIAGYTNNHGLSVSKTYEQNRALIARVENEFGGVLIHRFEYENDAAGRRTLRRDVDLATVISNAFSYNIRSEVTGAQMGTNLHNYAYDNIGNRERTQINASESHYQANDLNQYLSVTSVSSVVNLSYDSDGNMLTNGNWTYKWNGENRLILASNDQYVIENTYDYMGRRILKTSVDKSQGITNETRFIWDAWNVISETQVSGLGTQVSHYVWGLDLSGSMQGAGGIGGLLAVTQVSGLSNQVSCSFAAYDANGNVTEYVDTNGTVVAHYEYGPFGQTITATGTKKDDFPFRFSTKYLDVETDLYYYGLRFYSPEPGRWLSRDPIQELGFRSLVKEAYAVRTNMRFSPRTLWGLYLFVNNGPINKIDFLGLDCLDSYNMSLGKSGCCSPCKSKPFWSWIGYSSYRDCLWKRTGIPSLETAALGECIARLGKKRILSIISSISTPAEVGFQAILCAMNVCVSPSGEASSNGIRRLRNASKDDWDTTLSEDIINAIAEKIVEACPLK